MTKSHLSKKRLGLLALFVLIVLGTYLRVITVQHSVVDTPIRADAAHYYNYASNMKNWSTYSRFTADNEAPEPDALRSPGFPAFAYIFYDAIPEQFERNVQLAQTVLQVVSFAFLNLLLLRYYGILIALISGWFLWTFPHFVNINIYFLSESLFASCLALLIGLSIIIHNTTKKKNYYHILFGLLLGLTILVRPTLQYFPIFLFFVLWIAQRKINKVSIIILLAAMLPVIVWGLRNLIVMGAWSDPTLMINGLYHGSFPLFMYNNDPATFGFPYHYDPLSSEVYKGLGKTLQIIFSKAMAEPGSYLRWYIVGKQFFLWQWDIIAGQGDIFIYPTLVSPYYGGEAAVITHRVHQFIHLPWLLVAFSGLAALVKRVLYRQAINPAILVTAAFLLYAVLIHMVVAPFPRYGIPFKLFAIVVFAFSIKEVIEWLRKKFA